MGSSLLTGIFWKAAGGGYLSFEIISGRFDCEPLKVPDGWADVGQNSASGQILVKGQLFQSLGAKLKARSPLDLSLV